MAVSRGDCAPGGARLTARGTAPTEPAGGKSRLKFLFPKWATPSGKAVYSVFDGIAVNKQAWADDVLCLITIRSHDQYNTTIYGLDDRYRGVFGRRDVLFMHPADMAACGINHGDLVDIEIVSLGRPLLLPGLTAIEYGIARGSRRPTLLRLMCWCRWTTSIKPVATLPTNPFRSWSDERHHDL